MKKINLNELARDIATDEGGAVNLSIAQIKEVMRLVLRRLARYPLSAVALLLETIADETPSS